MILIIVIAPLSRLIIGQYFRNKGFNGESLADIVYWNTFSHLDAFFMGGIIPVLSLDKHIKKPHFLLAGSFLLALLAGIWEFTHYAAHKSYLRDLGYSIGQSANYEYVWHYSCLNLFFASLILVFVSIHSKQRFFRLRRILESKWLVNIGRVSYSMYIFHWLIWIHLFKYLLQPETYLFRIALFIPYLIVVYLFAELSYKFYEAPFIRLKDRFFPRSGIPAKELPVRPLLK
jgi:peptidoglycan/LPS O-acetylase OafA/YrhL